MKIKALRPSLREKKRYLAFEILSGQKTVTEAKTLILQGLRRYLGDYGMAGAGIVFLGEKYKDNKGLIRVNHHFMNHAKAGLVLITEAPVRSTGASGLLTKATHYYINEKGGE